jgi:hypothetical protein
VVSLTLRPRFTLQKGLPLPISPIIYFTGPQCNFVSETLLSAAYFEIAAVSVCIDWWRPPFQRPWARDERTTARR